MLLSLIRRHFLRISVLATSILTCTSCHHHNIPTYFIVSPPREVAPKLISIHIVDRNGLTETITNPERICDYACVDFLKPQPYKKVLRIFERDRCGNIPSLITSYYENGQVQKCLEVSNNRALGMYHEWFESGKLHMEVEVIGGVADITSAAENTWLFDGSGHVWDECGNILACINYFKGKLDGDSYYYHTNGQLWKRIPYTDGKQEGVFETYYKDGKLLQTAVYANDLKSGPLKRYWHNGNVATEENYQCGRLLDGKYYDMCGKCISSVENGEGQRAVFSEKSVREYHTYLNGVEDGEVRMLTDEGMLVKTWIIRNELKNGPETEYYPTPGLGQRAMPKLEINWYEGKIQGLTKTWYSNGMLESQREMAGNAKNGILTAYYRDGSTMMIEDYLDDKLIKGEYYRRGEKLPVSEVDMGDGTVTLFDPEGTFLRKISYKNSVPYE